MNELEIYSVALISKLDEINEKNQQYFKETIYKIQNEINEREVLREKIADVFISRIPISDQDKERFLALDYPSFSLDYKEHIWKTSHENSKEKVKKFFGEIAEAPIGEPLIKISNNEKFELFNRKNVLLPNKNFEDLERDLSFSIKLSDLF